MSCAEEEGIIAACVAGTIDEVRRILSEDPTQANRRDHFLGSTPLHFASHRGYADIVMLLLAAGADIEARERVSGTTPLHWAAEGGHPDVLGRLLAAGARLDPVDEWFALTPLGWASVVDWAPAFRDDRAAASRLLREHGARPDLFTAMLAGWEGEADDLVTSDPSLLSRRLGFVSDGMQPLHFAASRGLLEAAAALHDAGADLFAVTLSGLTPLALALRDGRGDIEALLRGRGLAEDLPSAIVVGDLSLTESLARKAGLAGALSGEGRYAGLLHYAAERGLAGAAALLLRNGANPDARMRWLLDEIPVVTPPLHRAARRGDIPMIRLLLEAGADFSAKDSVHNATPLEWARNGGREDVVRALSGEGG